MAYRLEVLLMALAQSTALILKRARRVRLEILLMTATDKSTIYKATFTVGY